MRLGTHLSLRYSDVRLAVPREKERRIKKERLHRAYRHRTMRRTRQRRLRRRIPRSHETNDFCSETSQSAAVLSASPQKKTKLDRTMRC